MNELEIKITLIGILVSLTCLYISNFRMAMKIYGLKKRIKKLEEKDQ